MKITRREFLKTASLYTLGSLGALAHSGLERLSQPADNTPNIIILLFDALSARNMSLYDYRRSTTPEMTRFAQRATVYHRHYAAGNFTSPGTASLLTGTYPWTHRAFQQAGIILRNLAGHNLFRYLDDSYQKAGFAQNLWADLLLHQFQSDLDVHSKSTAYSLDDYIHYNDGIWQHDPLIAFRSYEDFLEQDYGIPGSLYFGLVDKLRAYTAHAYEFRAIRKEYPRGIPNLGKYKLYFVLEDVFEGVKQEINRLSPPFLGYYHFFSPHGPYFPNRDFIGKFDDDWSPVAKPAHPLASNQPQEQLNRSRREYDEYVANVDAEFGRLYDYLQSTGLLDTSYLIVTSDHGELFERGIEGHVLPLLYEPVVHVPLIISAPGQLQRQDIYAPTSCVDITPTLLKVTGGSTPDWVEGSLLPGLDGEAVDDRTIFVVESKKNPSRSPLMQGTFAIIKGSYKLIWYLGYPEYDDVCELYDLKNDPEELLDLSQSQPEVLTSMKTQLQAKIAEVDEPFRGKG